MSKEKIKIKDFDHQSVKSQWKKIKGPEIRAQFLVGEKGITKIDLFSTGCSDGFEYKIIEQSPALQVIPLIEKWIEDYCKGKQSKVILPIVLDGLPSYTAKVLSTLRNLPLGETLSYQGLAEATDNPLGARAVGNACARNPCPLIIPCHRVLAKGGRLGGFSAGLDIKRLLLNFEQQFPLEF